MFEPEEELTPAALARLAAVDPASLGDDELPGYLAACARARNAFDGRVAAGVAALHARMPRDGVFDPRTLTSAEVGVALALGSGAADRLVDASVALVTRLPDTFAAVRSGQVSWQNALTLTESTAALTPEQASAVESRVLPEAGERTPARYRAAVLRAVDRVAPRGADERRRLLEADIKLIRDHEGSAMGQLYACLPSEQLDTVWLAADTWARRAKAAGDERSLDKLRVAALVDWARDFLGQPAVAKPSRHGRPARVRILWTLSALLGRTDAPGELADSGASLPASVVRELIAEHGAHLRRLVIDPHTGQLIDLTERSTLLPGRGTKTSVYEIAVIVTPADLDDEGLAEAAEPIRALMTQPVAGAPEDETGRYQPSARLAEFVTTRDRHPVNPTAGPSAASAADLDHTTPHRQGGPTSSDNLAAITRRWHRLATLGGWRRLRNPDGSWTWISPLSQQVETWPFDYRDLLEPDPYDDDP